VFLVEQCCCKLQLIAVLFASLATAPAASLAGSSVAMKEQASVVDR